MSHSYHNDVSYHTDVSHHWRDVTCHSTLTCPIHTYEWVVSHTYVNRSYHIWMGHVTHMNGSCHTYGVCHVTHMNGSCNTHEVCLTLSLEPSIERWVMSHIWMSHVTHLTRWWVMSHNIWIRHVALQHGWVMSHVWTSHVTLIYEWVTWHMWMSHVTHMNESWHTYE